MAQIEIKNLTFTYSIANSPAIKNISLNIEQGEFVVICGKTGCGKSTLLRNLKPLIRPCGKVQGEVTLDGRLVDKISDRHQAEKIGYVLQNPDNQIVTDKVWHELAFGLENLGYSKEDIRLSVAEMAEYFDMSEWYYESVDKLSGGQKQLLNLAAVMAMHPDIMILDEPTAQLDPIAAENFLDTIKKINEDLGITVIVSEHRLNQVLPMADKVLVMEQGEKLVYNTPQNVVKHIKDIELLRLMPIPTQVYIRSQSMALGENIPISISQGRKWIEKEISKEKVDITYKNIVTIKKEKAIKCKNLWFRYEKGGKDIISAFDLEINKGEIFAILGGNGSGKTTTLSLISKINKPYRGKINIDGRTGLLPQNVQTLFNQDTVKKELENVSEEIIKDMELDKLLECHPYDISGGQQQKLALAKVLKSNPDIILLDEPTKAIDGIYKEKLGEILCKLKAEGKTIVIVSHDVDFCGEYADRCGLFAGGSVVATNYAREFFVTNTFYTTTINKMAGRKFKNAIKKEDVLCYLSKKHTI